MKPKLSILIPSTNDRRTFNERIYYILKWQIELFSLEDDVELLFNFEDGTIGAKRNELVRKAKGEAMAFVDSDDLVCDGYLKHGMDFVNSGMDAASLIGLYFHNGIYDRPFVHSNQYTHWYTEPHRYVRTVNHLNFIKTDIARKISYPEKNFGEDGCYSDDLKASGLIKTEFEIKQALYIYFATSK